MKAPLENPSPNRWKQFSGQELYCSEVMRAASHLMKPVSLDAYNLSVYLTSWWNGSNANATIHPTEERVSAALAMTPDSFRAALQELEEIAWWQAVWNPDGSIKEYKPLFARREWKGQLKQKVSAYSGYSMNHGKIVARYIRAADPAATALMLWAVAHTRQNVLDLGYGYWLSDGRGKQGKLFHGTYFKHEALNPVTPESRDRLAQLDRLPESWTAEAPFRCEVTLEGVRQRIKMSDEDFARGLDEIESLGYWAVERHIDPFAPVNLPGIVGATLTPAYRLHSLVWEFDRRPGGAAISAWEQENSLGDRNVGERPPLGFHFVYGLQKRSTGEVIIIGQTTQPLTQRLQQHLRMATNSDANAVVRAVLESSEDTLDIIHLATVSLGEVAAYEMGLAQQMIAEGQPLQNKILTVEQNRRTIKADARFGALLARSRWEELAEAAQDCVAEQGGQSVLWEHADFRVALAA